jgi:RimJ/RimL family protein N-acetyltransferase
MINIRPAEAADARAVFEWRNDPLTRAASATTAEVLLTDHEAWFARMLGSAEHRLYIAQDSGTDEAVGMVRFDLVSDGTSADVSINLNPAWRGRGLGTPVLRAAIEEFDSSADEPVALHAVIRPTNAASIRIFEAVGFDPAGDDGILLHFWRETVA